MHQTRNFLRRSLLDRFFRSVSNFRVASNSEDLLVKIGGKEEVYPLVWLRDNCRCPQCFHEGSQSRMINWNDFDLNIKVKSLEGSADGLAIKWHDDHASHFSLKWLKERSFSKENRERVLNEVYRPARVLWDGRQFAAKKYDYGEVMSDDAKLYGWLKDLAVYGLAFMNNAPLDKKECFKLAERIAFIRRTSYGEDFHVVAKPGTSNVAYMSNYLQPHTDLPYYEYAPGTTILHCIEQTQSSGGQNVLADLFFVAEKLREEKREAFEILASVEVDWVDITQESGKEYHMVFRSPVISLDSEGNVDNIRHSVPQRGSHFTADIKYVKPWYEALRIFVDLINVHSLQFKTEPGQLFGFDNTRIAHGRLRYDDTNGNRRLLVGFYIDWDEIHSKLRVLSKKLH